MAVHVVHMGSPWFSMALYAIPCYNDNPEEFTLDLTTQNWLVNFFCHYYQKKQKQGIVNQRTTCLILSKIQRRWIKEYISIKCLFLILIVLILIYIMVRFFTFSHTRFNVHVYFMKFEKCRGKTGFIKSHNWWTYESN